jgi:hypothetical protein
MAFKDQLLAFEEECLSPASEQQQWAAVRLQLEETSGGNESESVKSMGLGSVAFAVQRVTAQIQPFLTRLAQVEPFELKMFPSL